MTPQIQLPSLTSQFAVHHPTTPNPSLGRQLHQSRVAIGFGIFQAREVSFFVGFGTSFSVNVNICHLHQKSAAKSPSIWRPSNSAQADSVVEQINASGTAIHLRRRLPDPAVGSRHHQIAAMIPNSIHLIHFHSKERAHHAPKGYLTVYEECLKLGLSLPLSGFLSEWLDSGNLLPSRGRTGFIEVLVMVSSRIWCFEDLLVREVWSRLSNIPNMAFGPQVQSLPGRIDEHGEGSTKVVELKIELNSTRERIETLAQEKVISSSMEYTKSMMKSIDDLYKVVVLLRSGALL
ncbi:hypothetical protein PHJA_002263100 [Phtheirospermum japonicum]|uniref:Uncharacterized protein n=1 Tax=Phtheirospermum japonicum TaxID=374723 RepID=A0A830D464_9LAMI|nr:hypothetical protein PHJA_002263100 [Phtheirospermum japonicum]